VLRLKERNPIFAAAAYCVLNNQIR